MHPLFQGPGMSGMRPFDQANEATCGGWVNGTHSWVLRTKGWSQAIHGDSF